MEECVLDLHQSTAEAPVEYFDTCAQDFSMTDQMELEELTKEANDERARIPSREDFKEEGEDLSMVPASPVRDEWPKDSLLTKDHFTIDTQKCITCRKDLGYAMPMNRIPKEKYLFCQGPDDICVETAIIQCFACDKHFCRDTGYFVHRPGNCAYTFPTQIYNFMCKYCYEEQMVGEPGFEETKQKMREFREYRRKMEEESKDIANLANSPSNTQPSHYKNVTPSPMPPFAPQPPPPLKRKRVDIDPTFEKEE